ncbi:MAG TPA: cupin domain-containing protein [Gaiellaceae bacterium]|nr:cupin domain-containing protein [Gaiellaceae bacterium]
MSEKFQVTRLDEIAPARGADGARWFRLRRDLDVGAFGVNAYGADAGKRVIEEHDELGTAAGKHEELYIVLRGTARFELDGEEQTVRAGSVVFVNDRKVRRGAMAEEDGTVVLVVGGTPGKAYEVSAWEEAGDAYPLWEDGKHEQAKEILSSVAEKHPEAGIVLYNLACVEAILGEAEPALEHLRRSIELEERFRELARTDEDFGAVRDRTEFRELVEPVA